MATLNVQKPRPKTHEGAPAHNITPYQELRRSVCACLLWEDEFYESGETIADRIVSLAAKCKPTEVSLLAIEARKRMNLRHAPLLLCAELAAVVGGALPAAAIYECVDRADELCELLAIHWRHGKRHIPHSMRRGLAAAFHKFDAYQLAKYDRKGKAVRLRDVIRLVHPKPKDDEQSAMWKQLIAGTLPTPDTWEVGLSAGGDKKAEWTRLLSEKKLGGMALLRNLRNMQQADVDKKLIRSALAEMKTGRILPFRFVAAAIHAPDFEQELEAAMFRSLAELPKLAGETVLLVDVSGSMDWAKVSARSEMTRRHAGAALATVARELCEHITVYTFASRTVKVPPRRGFGLIEAIMQTPSGGTNMGDAVRIANADKPDRIICITDEQSHQWVPDGAGKTNYVINVASAQNGVGYGTWTHIDGWSESVVRYIQELELDSPR